mmetsp:Transcript_32205/g.67725  ORF Transcript_32205/g.67725 Transcript_32205/m.67725 type:complete len:654 (+) Transcript_32205:76-2037(+)
MSDAKQIDPDATTLTAADTFRENFSFGDVETGAAVAGNTKAAASPASPNPTTREGKSPIRWVAGGTAALLLIIGLAVGLPKDNDTLETSASTGAAAPGPGVPTVILDDSEDAANAGANGPGGMSPFEPEETTGDTALLTWPEVISPTLPPTTAPTKSPSSSPSFSPSKGPSASPSTLEPSKSPTDEPTSSPSVSPSNKPTSEPTKQPTPEPSKSPIVQLDMSSWAALSWKFEPSASPSKGPTPAPSESPSKQPTPVPSASPSPAPSKKPTPEPTTASPTPNPVTDSPTVPVNPYFMGDEFVTNEELGIEMSAGLSVRLIAKTGEKVQYADGTESNDRWHTKSDAAGIIPLNPENPLEDGYVYVSNSEEGDGGGGVYGLYFDKDGNMMDYKTLLTGTTDNCGGGITPWNTWITCEEYEKGQCWQVDPINERALVTKLGGDGGRYESVAVDDRITNQPVFFTTEDHEEGALRRFVANGNDWDALHSDGETTFLNILDDNTYEWTTDEGDGKQSAADYFPNTEGVQVHEGKVYFMSKVTKTLIVLDLENMTYESETTGKKFYGEGSFGDQPDQNLFGPTRKYMYFTEDGGSSPGVYARYGSDGTYFTMFQAIKGGIHDGDETIGIALSLDHKRFYAGIQDNGYIMEFTRDDGMPFE